MKIHDISNTLLFYKNNSLYKIKLLIASYIKNNFNITFKIPDVDMCIVSQWIEYKELGELHIKINKKATHILCEQKFDLKKDDIIIPFFKVDYIKFYSDFVSIHLLLYYYNTVDEYILK